MTQSATKLNDAEQGKSVRTLPRAGTGPEVPVMPSPPSPPDEVLVQRARRFYRLGPSAISAERAVDVFEWENGGPLAWLAVQESKPGMPAVLLPGGREERATVAALDEVIERALETVRGAGHPAKVLGDLVPRLVRRLARRIRAEKQILSLREMAGEETDALRADLDLSGESGSALREDCDRLLSALPLSWGLIGPAVSPEVVALECLRLSREAAHLEMEREVRTLAEQVDDILRVDALKGTSSGLVDGLRHGLGHSGLRFIDFEALARHHPDRKATRLEPGRRERLEGAAKVLANWMSRRSEEPRFHLVGTAEEISRRDNVDLPSTAIKNHERPLRAALDVFLEAAGPVVELARALRVARLEVSGAYRPDVHDDSVASLDWQALRPDELALVAPVLVLRDYQSLLESDVGDLCDLIWAGRPVIVLATARSPHPVDLQDITRHQRSLGAMLIAMHHAWVAQTATSHPRHLVSSLIDTDHRRPSVALVARPENPLFGETCVAGRAWPLFVFRPGATAGELDILGTPSHADDWAGHQVSVRDAKALTALGLPVTFADAAAWTDLGRAHVLPVPSTGWTGAQIAVHDWISHPDRDRPTGPLPFIWLVGQDGKLWRGILSRALALATHDRLRDFRLLQEMSGVGGVHVAKARESTRREVREEAEAEMIVMTARHEEALELAVRDAARNAMAGLAATLLSGGPVSSHLSPTTGRPAEAKQASIVEEPVKEGARPPAEQVKEQEEEPLLLDPWIDTPCCTSCNDCFKINERLFRYDDNKQAVFADLSKGTYADLVRAAEVCPAKCIHPGKPKPDDPTATPEMVARGAKL